MPVVIPMDSQCSLTRMCGTEADQDLSEVIPVTISPGDSKKPVHSAPSKGKPEEIVLGNVTIVGNSGCVESEMMIGGALDHDQKGELLTITTSVDTSCFLRLTCKYPEGSYQAVLRPQQTGRESLPDMVLDETHTAARK